MDDFLDDESESFEFDPEGFSDDDTAVIELVDGTSTVVSAKLLPMLMEWDWVKDPTTGTIVRTSDQRPLFDEHVRLGMRFKGGMEHPGIDRGLIRSHFGKQASYKSMLSMSLKARDYTIHDFGVTLPAAGDLLADALYSSLATHYRWVQEGVRWTFTPDTDGLIPGTLIKTVGEPLPLYQSLGEWMDKEYNGVWTKAPRTPTGLKPMTYAKGVEKALHSVWRSRVEYENGDDEIDFPVLERGLKEAGLSVWMLLRYAVRVVRTYRPTR
jgi:hypothetical protein